MISQHFPSFSLPFPIFPSTEYNVLFFEKLWWQFTNRWKQSDDGIYSIWCNEQIFQHHVIFLHGKMYKTRRIRRGRPNKGWNDVFGQMRCQNTLCQQIDWWVPADTARIPTSKHTQTLQRSTWETWKRMWTCEIVLKVLKGSVFSFNSKRESTENKTTSTTTTACIYVYR